MYVVRCIQDKCKNERCKMYVYVIEKNVCKYGDNVLRYTRCPKRLKWDLIF